MSHYPSHDNRADYGQQQYAAPPADPYDRQPRRSRGVAGDRVALLVQSLGYLAAAVIACWLLLYYLDANRGNGFVGLIHDLATWLSGWSQDIFTMQTEGLRVLLNYGLAALVYLGVGTGLAAWIRRL